MQFTFTESALKDIKKLPVTEAKRMKRKLTHWQGLESPLLLAKPLTKHKEATHRFRLGAYRILVKVIGQELRILRVRHRKDVYK